MLVTAAKVCMAAFAMIIASCLVSTMAIFMGGGQGGTDLRELMLLQIASVPLSVLAIAAALLISKLKSGDIPGVKKLYAGVPQWMALAFFLLFLLVGSGEIAFLIVTRAAGIDVAWTAHAPLASMFACSLAICVLYACSGHWSSRPDPVSGRW